MHTLCTTVHILVLCTTMVYTKQHTTVLRIFPLITNSQVNTEQVCFTYLKNNVYNLYTMSQGILQLKQTSCTCKLVAVPASVVLVLSGSYDRSMAARKLSFTPQPRDVLPHNFFLHATGGLEASSSSSCMLFV